MGDGAPWSVLARNVNGRLFCQKIFSFALVGYCIICNFWFLFFNSKILSLHVLKVLTEGFLGNLTRIQIKLNLNESSPSSDIDYSTISFF